jgi:hypothetical protein
MRRTADRSGNDILEELKVEAVENKLAQYN